MRFFWGEAERYLCEFCGPSIVYSVSVWIVVRLFSEALCREDERYFDSSISLLVSLEFWGASRVFCVGIGEFRMVFCVGIGENRDLLPVSAILCGLFLRIP